MPSLQAKRSRPPAGTVLGEPARCGFDATRCGPNGQSSCTCLVANRTVGVVGSFLVSNLSSAARGVQPLHRTFSMVGFVVIAQSLE